MSRRIPPIPPVPEAVLTYAVGGPASPFVADPALDAWVRAHLIGEEGSPAGPLTNADHEILRAADVRFAYAAEPCRSKQRSVIGRAHLGQPSGSDAWKSGQRADWLRRVFGAEPDFFVLLYAPFVADRMAADDAASVLALVEHELYHCRQEQGPDGPRFHRSGQPVWACVGHDVEEFVGVVRRYGAWSADLKALVGAAERGPTIAPAGAKGSPLHGLCGTCNRPVLA